MKGLRGAKEHIKCFIESLYFICVFLIIIVIIEELVIIVGKSIHNETKQNKELG